MNQVVLWRSIPLDYNQKYSILQILDDENGLKASLLGADNLEYELDYTNCSLCMYRNYEETFCSGMLGEYIRVYGSETIGGHTFFEVLSSEEISQVEQWGLGSTYMGKSPLHLMLFADTCVFETVSYGAPVLHSRQNPLSLRGSDAIADGGGKRVLSE